MADQPIVEDLEYNGSYYVTNIRQNQNKQPTFEEFFSYPNEQAKKPSSKKKKKKIKVEAMSPKRVNG